MITRTKKIIKRVAFFGDASASPKDDHFQEAQETAKLLAENGYIIVNGGGPGVMLAATRGAKSAGGRVELCILDKKREPDNYEGINKENFKLADKKYITANYENRLNKLIEVADAFVIFKGGSGTLSEVGLTWELAKFNYGQHEPLIFFGECWRGIVRDLINDLNLEKIERNVVETADTPEEVLEIITRINGKKIKFRSWWERAINWMK